MVNTQLGEDSVLVGFIYGVQYGDISTAHYQLGVALSGQTTGELWLDEIIIWLKDSSFKGSFAYEIGGKTCDTTHWQADKVMHVYCIFI